MSESNNFEVNISDAEPPKSPINIETEHNSDPDINEDAKSIIMDQHVQGYSPSFQQLHSSNRFNYHNDIVGKYNLDKWEYLYQSDARSKMQREELMKKRQEEYHTEMMKECSFQPKLRKNDKYSKYIKKQYKGDIFKRTTNWKKNVNNKVFHLLILIL